MITTGPGVTERMAFRYDGPVFRSYEYDDTRRSGVELSPRKSGATGLDYFGARCYSGAKGRFTSPDPLSGTLLHVLNAQRWNMYAYAVNNPLSHVDSDGRDAIAVVYLKMAVHMGHAGIASVHGDGRGT